MTDPQKNVENWLEKQGYPYEYEVARTLAQAGFRTWQGMHYRDTESTEQRTREIDVVAMEWPHDKEGPKRAAVELVVEVKFTKAAWLVMTTSLAVGPPSLHRLLLMTDKASAPLKGLMETPPVPNLLQLPERHGFSVVQTAEGGDKSRGVDPAYAALNTVVKAANARVGEVGKHGVAVAFPVIVVAGPVFQLGYDTKGNRILNPVLWQRIRWQGSSVVDHPVLVDVVQIEHLPTWATKARKDAVVIDKLLEDWVTPGSMGNRD